VGKGKSKSTLPWKSILLATGAAGVAYIAYERYTSQSFLYLGMPRDFDAEVDARLGVPISRMAPLFFNLMWDCMFNGDKYYHAA
jgi:hypothetical protein